MTTNLQLATQQLLEKAEITEQQLKAVLNSLLSDSIDAADIYLQSSHSESWMLEDGIIKSGTYANERGVGVRAMSGEKTGFAYYSYASIYKESLLYIMDEKTFFGSGKDSFPERCKNYRAKYDENSIIYGYFLACPSHSHNIYLEIALTSGIFGLAIFSFFLILKIINLTKILINFKEKKSYNFFCFLLFFICLLIEILPLRPYGNIFSSYNGFLFFFKISVLYSLMIKISRNEKFN